MTERTLAERLRAIAEPRFSPLLPEEVTTLREAAAALERLEKLERFLDREGIRRGPIDHGMPTPEIVDRVEAYGYECAIRAIRATPAPPPQQGGREKILRSIRLAFCHGYAAGHSDADAWGRWDIEPRADQYMEYLPEQIAALVAAPAPAPQQGRDG